MSIFLQLSTIWAFIIAIAVFLYVVMDGFDLGIGILFPFLKDEKERVTAMNAIAPVWDGNETWLVMGGGGLLAAFPLAYSVLMPAIYVPVVAMLIGLVFRGVAFEFRFQTVRWRRFWEFGFFAGSAVAALAQGIALGAILQGVKVVGRAYGGGWWDWLTPFSLLTGVSVIAGYTLLGSCWLIWRTEGALQTRAREFAHIAGAATMIAIFAVSAATPFLSYAYFDRWLAWPNILFVAPVPFLVLALADLFYIALKRGYERAPFFLALGVFALCFVGLGISMFPWMVPQSITIAEAAAPYDSQLFLIVGAVVLIPIILAYTAYSYWLFRGKVGDEGYH